MVWHSFVANADNNWVRLPSVFNFDVIFFLDTSFMFVEIFSRESCYWRAKSFGEGPVSFKCFLVFSVI